MLSYFLPSPWLSAAATAEEAEQEEDEEGEEDVADELKVDVEEVLPAVLQQLLNPAPLMHIQVAYILFLANMLNFATLLSETFFFSFWPTTTTNTRPQVCQPI